MSLTDRQYLGTVLLGNLGTFSTDTLDAYIAQEGDIKLAQAAAYEVEASKVMFSFKAGDVSADKSKYAANLLKSAAQIREDHAKYGGEISSVASWSGSDSFGTAGVEEWIDTDYSEPQWY